MKNHNNAFYGIATLATCFFLSATANAQTVNNLSYAQSVPQASEVPQVEAAPQPAVAAPEANQPQQPAVPTTAAQHEQHKTATKTVKHASTTTHHKKKTPHKTKAANAKSHTKKAASRKDDTKHKHAKKTVPPQQPHASNAHKHPKHQVAKANPAPQPKKHTTDVSTAALPVVKSATPAEAHTPKAASNIAPKSVTYNFCMGYSNCTPTRYQTTSAEGKMSAKVLQKDKDGNWNQAQCDPTVMSDLNKMAAAETNGRVERELTPSEKAQLADHQGKMHATLVSQVNSGNKEEAKNTMRQLHIQNMADLNAYDSRLCVRETATQAVGEISTGR